MHHSSPLNEVPTHNYKPFSVNDRRNFMGQFRAKRYQHPGLANNFAPSTNAPIGKQERPPAVVVCLRF